MPSDNDVAQEVFTAVFGGRKDAAGLFPMFFGSFSIAYQLVREKLQAWASGKPEGKVLRGFRLAVFVSFREAVPFNPAGVSLFIDINHEIEQKVRLLAPEEKMKQIGATLGYCIATIDYGLSHHFFLHRDLGKARELGKNGESWYLMLAQAAAIRKFLEEAGASYAVPYIRKKIAFISSSHRQEYSQNKKEFMASFEAAMS